MNNDCTWSIEYLCFLTFVDQKITVALTLLTPVFPSLSDPAKSTKWSLEDNTLAIESTRERD